MIENQKVNITGGEHKNYSGKLLSKVNATDWLVKVNLGGGKSTRTAIDERYLEPLKVKPVKQVRGQGGLTLQNRMNAY
jgi:hypothetical protein